MYDGSSDVDIGQRCLLQLRIDRGLVNSTLDSSISVSSFLVVFLGSQVGSLYYSQSRSSAHRRPAKRNLQ